MSSESVVSVCVATYKRPHQLARLLKSFNELHVPVGTIVEIIVTDNDQACTGRETVGAYRECSSFPVIYSVEPVKNISLARNRSVSLATGDFIAFVDDDEEVTPHWLDKLMQAGHNFGADVVFGPVIYQLPSHAPRWIRKGPFYAARRMATGTAVNGGATGNAFVRASLLKSRKEPFNPCFGLTGSEDYDLFRRLSEEGAKFVWCNEALVWEHVGEERLSINYLIKKALRGGQLYAVINLPRLSFSRRLSWFIYRIALLCLAIMGLLCSIPFGRHCWVRWLQKVFSNAGQLSALTRFRFEQYR